MLDACLYLAPCLLYKTIVFMTGEMNLLASFESNSLVIKY